MAFAIDTETTEMEIQKYKNKISSIDSKIRTLTDLKNECVFFLNFLSTKYEIIEKIYKDSVLMNDCLVNFILNGKQFLKDKIKSFSSEIYKLLVLLGEYYNYSGEINNFCVAKIEKLNIQKKVYKALIIKLQKSAIFINKGGM